MSGSSGVGAWERASTALLGTLLGAGVLWATGSVVVTSMLDGWAEAGRSVIALHVALVVSVTALGLGLLVRVGPLAASPAEVQWSLEPPSGARADGRPIRLLLGGAFVVALAAAATLVVAPALFRVTADPVLGVVVVGTVAVVVAGPFVALLALAGQLADARALLVSLCSALVVGAVAVAAAGAREGAVAILLAAAAAAVLVVGARGFRARRPRRVAPRWLLVRASQERWAAVAGITLLDGSVTRRVRDRWRTASSPWPRAVLLRDHPGRPATVRTAAAVVVLLLVRQGRRIVVATAGAGYVAHLVAGAGSPTTALGIVLVTMGALAVATSGPADLWAQAPALARTYPTIRPWQLLAPSTAGLVLVAVVGAAASGAGVAQVVVLLVAAPLVVLSRHKSHSVTTGALASTPLGPVDVGQGIRLVAGWDVVLVALGVVALL